MRFLVAFLHVNEQRRVLEIDFVLLENQFTQTVEAVSKTAGWTVDRKVVLAIASTYVASRETFDTAKYKE